MQTDDLSRNENFDCWAFIVYFIVEKGLKYLNLTISDGFLKTAIIKIVCRVPKLKMRDNRNRRVYESPLHIEKKILENKKVRGEMASPAIV